VSGDALRVLRRSWAWFAAALLLVLLSIPAVFDLRTLLIGLAVICAGLGVVTAAFTWFDKAQRPDVEPAETE